MHGNLQLQEYLDPYDISWELRDRNNQWTPMLLSKELTIHVSDPMDTTMYQCSLKISRCTRFNKGNEVDEHCPPESDSPYRGPVINIRVFGKKSPFNTTIP